ncbi:MAG TPA: septal ring lytic transglycosylase RlpA family protein [Stellaceae bacterium]|nr:septal ring lytic transglycosylase RlpA family protein [Stellaceae bacterium]
MNFRCAIVFSLAALASFGSARADQPPARGAAVKAIVHTAAVTRRVAKVASTATTAHIAVKVAVPAKVAAPVKAAVSAKVANVAPASRVVQTPHPALKLADMSGNPPRDKIVEPGALCIRPAGKVETGTAAWYGGTYIGRRTSSGSPLDTTHLTAAHRTLPLNSLARVTNLQNGRSVVVRVTDRGPISTSLLIDMSPRAADELQMKHAGLVPVRVEPVIEVAAASK